MAKKLIETFSVERLEILDEDGNCDEELRPALDNAQVKQLYEWMVLARTFDDKAFKLQREGRLGTYASILGQEAAQVGSAYALRPADWMVPSFRESAARASLPALTASSRRPKSLRAIAFSIRASA